MVEGGGGGRGARASAECRGGCTASSGRAPLVRVSAPQPGQVASLGCPLEVSHKREEKAHRKSPPKKKSKGKGKKKVEEKPKHVHHAVEGEPHRKMPTGATRGEKYQAGAAYDNDVHVMQRTPEGEYDVSLGRVCHRYKVWLAEDARARREWGVAQLLVTDVRAYSVQVILRCGTQNAQSTATARELFEERYRSSTPRQVVTGLIMRVSVCTSCVGAPGWPTNFGDPSVGGLPLAKLKAEPLAAGFGARRSAGQLSAFGAEVIVDTAADVLRVYYIISVLPLWHLLRSVPRAFHVPCLVRVLDDAPLRCPWGCLPVLRALRGLYRRKYCARFAWLP